MRRISSVVLFVITNMLFSQEMGKGISECKIALTPKKSLLRVTGYLVGSVRHLGQEEVSTRGPVLSR